MPTVQHQHISECPFSEGYTSYLVDSAPDIFWYNIQDVGSYQGTVFAVGKYKNHIVIFEDYYGSCSGCGAWGEGGEPTDQDDVLAHSKLFNNHNSAKDYLDKFDSYEHPNIEAMKKAIDEIKF